jgi:hypothetical protein
MNSVGRASGEGVPVLKVQRVILTFFTWFTFFLHLSSLESGHGHGQNIGRNFYVGWSDPGITLATESCAKGVAPAQHGVLPVSKLIVAPDASWCSLGTCSIAKVTARVTHMVIFVFHAHFTFPRSWKWWMLFNIVDSSTNKEALTTEKVRKNSALPIYKKL